ncbi:MAG: DUF4270 family protein [Bacteroidales bacterium]|nr:DUF4270 family protein [Bacteroidales bacterium]
MFRIKYLLFLIPLFLVSCVEEDPMLGMGLVEESDKVNANIYDKFDINAFLFHEDSLKTNDYHYMTLGTYTDNYFGKVTTSMFSQISLSSTTIDFNFYKNKSDSIVLALTYAGAFTKDTSIKSMEMQIEIFEITEQFVDSLSYYQQSSMQYNPVPIVTQNVIIAPRDSVEITGGKLPAHLRVNLGNDFLQKIINAGYHPNNKSFLEFFKGFYIKLSPTANSDANGMIAYFNMYSSNSGMMLYYKDNAGKTQKYNFLFDLTSRRFSHIDYDFSASEISQFSSKRKLPTDTLDCNSSTGRIHLATLGISAAKLNIKDLMQWYNDSTQNLGGFNQAMLILPVNDDYIASVGGTQNIPAKIICYRMDENGKLTYIHDAFSSAEQFMGTFDKTTNSYRMRITSHLQNYLNGNIKSSDIYLMPDNRTSTAARVILNGPKNSTRPAKIEIIYTR